MARFARLFQFLRHELAPVADAVLLQRFAQHRDEAAFAELVERHGPLVRRVCRRALADPAAADDAFQATFLVLARKAGAIQYPERLAGFLHGVACRAARKASSAQRLRQWPADAPEPADPRPDPLAELSARDLLTAIDEEVARLPENNRLPVILCCLEGLSLEEAAARLGWSRGSVKGRLERGRVMLHARLVRRGLKLPAVLAAVELSRQAGTVPVVLVTSTARAAAGFAVSQIAGIPANVITLTQELLNAMSLTRIKIAVLVLLALCGTITAAGLMSQALRQPPADNPTPAAQDERRAGPEPRPKPLEKPDAQTEAKIKVLQQERRDLLKKAMDTRKDEFEAGRATLDSLIDVAKQWLKAELDVVERQEARVSAWQSYLELLKEAEKRTKALYEAGRITAVDYLVAQAARIEAEVGWLKAGGKEEKPKKEK